MPTQQHHEWLKTYLRMTGSGGGTASGARASTPASATNAAAPAQMSMEKESADGDEEMSLVNGGQSTESDGAEAAESSPAAEEGSEASKGEEAPQSANVIRFPFTLSTPEAKFMETTLGGGRFKAELTASYQLQFTVELADPLKEGGAEAAKKNAISLFGANGAKYAASIAQVWANEEGFKIFDLETAITELEQKATFEADGKGLEIAYEGAATLSCGASVSVKAVLIGYEGGSKGGEVEPPSLVFGGNIPPFKPKDFPIPDIRAGTLRGISMFAHIEGKLEPVWEKIFVDVAKKFAEVGGAEAAFDAGITAGLLVAAFGVIPASFAQLIKGDDVNSAGTVVNEVTNSLTKGFELGISGAEGASDEIGALGYRAGRQLFDQGYKIVKEKVPDASDDFIRQRLAELAKTNDWVTRTSKEFQDRAAASTWDHYATTYRTRFDRMNAFGLIYPEKKGKWNDPLFTKYQRD